MCLILCLSETKFCYRKKKPMLHLVFVHLRDYELMSYVHTHARATHEHLRQISEPLLNLKSRWHLRLV